jgi:hypothetical protein
MSSGARMGKKQFFGIILRVLRKIHLRPGLPQQNIKTGIIESLKGRGEHPYKMLI